MNIEIEDNLVPMGLATPLARFGWTLVALAHGELQAWLAWIIPSKSGSCNHAKNPAGNSFSC